MTDLMLVSVNSSLFPPVSQINIYPPYDNLIEVTNKSKRIEYTILNDLPMPPLMAKEPCPPRA